MTKCQETEIQPDPYALGGQVQLPGDHYSLVFISIVVVIATAISEPAELSEVAVIFGVIISLVAVLYGLTPTAYILGSEGFEIIRRFAPPVLLPYTWIRNVYLKQFSSQPRAYFGFLPTHGTWVYFGGSKLQAWAGSGSMQPLGRKRWWCWRPTVGRTIFRRPSRKSLRGAPVPSFPH